MPRKQKSPAPKRGAFLSKTCGKPEFMKAQTLLLAQPARIFAQEGIDELFLFRK